MIPSDVLQKLQLEFAIEIDLPDPISGEVRTLSYPDVHRLLALDLDSIAEQSQICPSLLAEMARCKAAAEIQATHAEAQYKRWKAKIYQDQVAKADRDGKKPPTQAAAEACYRSAPGYVEKSTEPGRYRALAGLFGSLVRAFEVKARMLSDRSRDVAGYEHSARAEDQSLGNFAQLAEEASEIASASNSSGDLQQLLAKIRDSNESEPAPVSRKKKARKVM